MKKGSNLIMAISHLKISKEFFEDFIRERPSSRGAKIFAGYVKRINWIYEDLFSNPLFDDTFREGIKAEWFSDPFTVEAIIEKISLLNPDQKNSLEAVVDNILAGEELTVILSPNPEQDAKPQN